MNNFNLIYFLNLTDVNNIINSYKVNKEINKIVCNKYTGCYSVLNLYHQRHFDIIDNIMSYLNLNLENKELKKIILMEFLKNFNNNYLITKDNEGNWFIAIPKKTTSQSTKSDDEIYHYNDYHYLSGFFGKLIDKTIKATKKTGRKIQKELLDPVRESIKKINPKAWDAIEKFDRKLAFTTNLKGFHKQLEKYTRKYGETAIRLAITIAASYCLTPVGVMAVNALMATLDNLSEKQVKVLKKAEQQQPLNPEEQEVLTNIQIENLMKIQDEMLKKPNGEEDFKKMIEEAKKLKDSLGKK